MLLLAGTVVALGAVVQGAVGFGLALVAAPLLALLDPALVPVPLIMLATVHAVLAMLRESREVDWHGIGWAMVGRLPGTALGVLAVTALPQRGLAIVIGVCVLAFALLSMVAWQPRPTPGALLVAGVASGAGGTAASIGGPPLALLYQHTSGPRVRATMAAYFVLGSAVSVAALAMAGQVGTRQLMATMVLTPFLVVGFALSGPACRVLDAGWTRRAVLAVAAGSAVLLIGQAAVG